MTRQNGRLPCMASVKISVMLQRLYNPVSASFPAIFPNMAFSSNSFFWHMRTSIINRIENVVINAKVQNELNKYSGWRNAGDVMG